MARVSGATRLISSQSCFASSSEVPGVRRTLPLAGAGAVEALLPFALTWVGYGLPAAVLAVFAYRVFNLWLPIVPAALGLRSLKAGAV